MAELKPCPFCGGKMSMIYRSSDNAFHVFHASGFDAVKCPILEPFLIDSVDDMSLRGAAEAWNRRADNEGRNN